MYFRRRVAVLLVLCSAMLASCGTNPSTNKAGASLTSIEVTPATPSIAKGTTQAFTATGRYSDNTTQDITALVSWSSSSSNVATIGNAAGTEGKAIAVSIGTTTISATTGSISNSTVLTVTLNQMGGSLQGNDLNLIASVSTLAGVAPGTADGTGSAARFFYPSGITSDGTNLYSIDANGTVRKIVIATGEVTTLGGTPGVPGLNQGGNSSWYFTPPHGITTDGKYVYTAFSSVIQKIDLATGATTTLAGSMGAWGTADGVGTDARFYFPYGITSDGINLYVSDTYNNTIRKVVISTGEVTTFAGKAQTFGSTDGIGDAARFSRPSGITTDGTNLYITDHDNATVRKIVIATKEVSTLAGTAGAWGSADGTGSTARFRNPNDITTDGTSLFVTDSGTRTIRKIIIATSDVTTLAGTDGTIGWSDGTGTAAQFAHPDGIYTDGINLYVTDLANCNIRRIAISTGEVSTFAGTSTQGSSDGIGSAARFYEPGGITTDGANLYVTDYHNHTIRKITAATGQVITLAGSAGTSGADDGNETSARFSNPAGLTTDGANLYVADSGNNTIRKIVIASGDVTTFAGSALSSGSTDSTGTNARFNSPAGITTDGANLYISDSLNHTIRKIAISTGEVTTIAGSAGLSGTDDGTGVNARFKYPGGITTDGINLYIESNHSIRKVVIASGEVTTLAGVSGTLGYADGSGSSALFSSPSGITTDGTSLYISDSWNGLIRKLVLSTNEVTTLAGTTFYEGAQDGTGTSAMFNVPRGITTDGTSLFVADTFNNTIRKIQ